LRQQRLIERSTLPNPFETGNLAWLWYGSWLAAIAGLFALVAVTHARIKFKNARFQTYVLVLLGLGFLSTLPLAVVRLGVNLGGWEDAMAILSFAGTGGAAIYLGFQMRAIRLVKWVNKRISERQASVAAKVAASAESGATTGGVTGGVSNETGTDGIDETGAVSAWLHFRSGPALGQSIPLSPGVTRLGRDHTNDVVIDDPNASRMHAEIELKGGQYFLRDAGSSGGTMFDSQKVSGEKALVSGSTIMMGGTELVFTAAEAVTQFSAGSAGTVVSGLTPAGDVTVRSTTVDALRPGETMLGGADADDDQLAAWLAVASGPLKGQICQLSSDRTTIGRDGSNQLVVNDPAVSRSHAVVIARDNDLVLIDLGSAGGTTVNGRSVSGKSVKTVPDCA